MKIIYALTKFENLDLETRQGAKLRGYFANQYKENELIHNHEGQRVIYQYPRVQYKVIDGVPVICGIEEGADLIANIGKDTDSIFIEGQELEIFQKEITKEKREFGLTDNYVKYKFLTPWVALNQKNYKVYSSANDMEREEILKKILVGNILSMAKGLNYIVSERIYSWIDLEECTVNFKNIKMKAFKGEFKINFIIPDYLGIGKSVSRGFGTIKRG